MIKFQYNKTSLQQIEKDLKMRKRTLPIIKSKETALRLEVKRCKEEADVLERKLEEQIAGYERMYALWGEFDTSLVSLKDVQLDVKKVAGVRVPVLLNIELDVKPFGLFSAPKWYFDGINLLQGLAKTAVEREFVETWLDRRELDYLIYNDPAAYAELVLNGDVKAYLDTVRQGQ